MCTKQIYKILLVASACALLAACGQEGPLYHPGTQTPYGPAEYSPLHPAKSEVESKNKKETPSTQARQSTQHEETMQ